MAISVPNNRLFRAFGDWCIRRAMRTPYFHLFHDDGTPYMERFWLLRLGQVARRRRMLEQRIVLLEQRKKDFPYDCRFNKVLDGAIDKTREQLYPWLGIRVHHIQSGDERVPHDHPWSFITIILRGGYTEVRPRNFYRNVPAGGYTSWRDYSAGSIRLMRATDFHYLTLKPWQDTWTLFITFRKRQSWGFLVNGVKVPWRQYLAQRKLLADKSATQ